MVWGGRGPLLRLAWFSLPGALSRLLPMDSGKPFAVFLSHPYTSARLGGGGGVAINIPSSNEVCQNFSVFGHQNFSSNSFRDKIAVDEVVAGKVILQSRVK